MIINGIEIGGGTTGEISYRFVTTPTTLAPGLRQVMNDMYLLTTYNISAYTDTYTIASQIVYNDALLSILEVIWIDGSLIVNGIFSLGI